MTTTMDAMLPYRNPSSAAPAADSYVEGEVYDVTPAGLRFTVKKWDGGKHVFGPALLAAAGIPSGAHVHDPDPGHSHVGGPIGTHEHPAPVPRPGYRCLVLFLGGGVDRPWVLGWHQ